MEIQFKHSSTTIGFWKHQLIWKLVTKIIGNFYSIIGIIIYGFIIIATSFKKKYKLYLPSEEKLTFFKKLSNFIIFKFKVINSYY